MHAFHLVFVAPSRVEGLAAIDDEDARRQALTDLVGEDGVTPWSSLRIRGPELDRTLATIEQIFGQEPNAFARVLLANPFPAPIPQHVPYASYLDPPTTKRWAERLTATPDQDDQLDEDEEVARVYAWLIDGLQEAADRNLAIILDSDG